MITDIEDIPEIPKNNILLALQVIGQEYEQNFIAAYYALITLRKMRGYLLESPNLSEETIDTITDLAARIGLSIGEILLLGNKAQYTELETLITGSHDYLGEEKSRYDSYIAMTRWAKLLNFLQTNPNSDDLSEHFQSDLGRYFYLEGLSLEQLSNHKGTIVIAPSASTAIIEAGFIAAYLNNIGIIFEMENDLKKSKIIYKKIPGWFPLIEGFIFIFILILGLLYAWKKGDLKWV